MSIPSGVQVIPYPDTADRIETGAVQFGNDWPGLFVRCDNALDVAMAIEAIERFVGNGGASAELDNALSSLRWIAEIVRRDVIVGR
jgi:hypothetical protein